MSVNTKLLIVTALRERLLHTVHTLTLLVINELNSPCSRCNKTHAKLDYTPSRWLRWLSRAQKKLNTNFSTNRKQQGLVTWLTHSYRFACCRFCCTYTPQSSLARKLFCLVRRFVTIGYNTHTWPSLPQNKTCYCIMAMSRSTNFCYWIVWSKYVGIYNIWLVCYFSNDSSSQFCATAFQ